jgi:transposase-like protein
VHRAYDSSVARYVTAGDRKPVVASLRGIYTADTEEAAAAALDAFDERWLKKYPSVRNYGAADGTSSRRFSRSPR